MNNIIEVIDGAIDQTKANMNDDYLSKRSAYMQSQQMILDRLTVIGAICLTYKFKHLYQLAGVAMCAKAIQEKYCFMSSNNDVNLPITKSTKYRAMEWLDTQKLVLPVPHRYGGNSYVLIPQLAGMNYPIIVSYGDIPQWYTELDRALLSAMASTKDD